MFNDLQLKHVFNFNLHIEIFANYSIQLEAEITRFTAQMVKLKTTKKSIMNHKEYYEA